jgi:hypothetical protein
MPVEPRAPNRTALERAIREYYDSLGDKELAEQASWADLALAEFPETSD